MPNHHWKLWTDTLCILLWQEIDGLQLPFYFFPARFKMQFLVASSAFLELICAINWKKSYHTTSSTTKEYFPTGSLSHRASWKQMWLDPTVAINKFVQSSIDPQTDEQPYTHTHTNAYNTWQTTENSNQTENILKIYL